MSPAVRRLRGRAGDTDGDAADDDDDDALEKIRASLCFTRMSQGRCARQGFCSNWSTRATNTRLKKTIISPNNMNSKEPVEHVLDLLYWNALHGRTFPISQQNALDVKNQNVLGDSSMSLQGTREKAGQTPPPGAG